MTDATGLRPGVRWTGTGAVFTVYSRNADRVWLMLFDRLDSPLPDREIELDPAAHRRGDFWTIEVDGVWAGQGYLYRMDGRLGLFDPGQWLLDPYAKAVHSGRGWGERTGLEPGLWPRDGAAFPKGLLLAEDEYDWAGDRPPGIPLSETVIYEAHLRGFTAHPNSGAAYPGTYRSFGEKIPYLKDLGITAVEFLPLQEFNEMEFFLENGTRRNLRNFWGYSTQSYFAPMARYAADQEGSGPIVEFRDLVKGLHAAGIEVILDVVFNHTGEWDEKGPVFSFKGLDQITYYILKPDGSGYENFSGCGNTVKANHPAVQEFILDCLRYWVEEMHVDGFRFDLASVFARDVDGRVLERSPLIDRISSDPVLARVKLFAEAWDAAGLFQVGSFPHSRWSEWNGLFRDEVRRFWTGEPRLLGRMATRLAGSADLYERPGQSPQKSVNFVACHDGFTLADLVRYTVPHNNANGRGGLDGERHNHSANHGVEGPSDDPEIEALRLRQQKNYLATLFLSQGVPMLMAGDECGRTQRGNNNAYVQDNEISWMDWDLARINEDLRSFVRALIAFRRAHPGLRRPYFYRGRAGDGFGPDILWYGPDGGGPDWENGEALAFLIDGDRRSTGGAADDDDLFLIINGSSEVRAFCLPERPGRIWRTAWSTMEKEPRPEESERGAFLRVEGRSVTALLAPIPIDPTAEKKIVGD
jgi:glycogen operon protein